jgi:signal peptidase II
MKLPELAPKQGWWLLIIAVPLIVLDQLTKQWALGLQTQDAITIIPGFWDFVYVENRGSLWGLGGNFSELYKVVVLRGFSTLVTLVVLALVFVKTPHKLYPVIYAFVIAGAVGNLIDRFMRGFVIDFIDWRLGDFYHHPTFNIADVAIVVAISLVLIDALFLQKKKEN